VRKVRWEGVTVWVKGKKQQVFFLYSSSYSSSSSSSSSALYYLNLASFLAFLVLGKKGEITPLPRHSGCLQYINSCFPAPVVSQFASLVV
jgi:hypothetical protein